MLKMMGRFSQKALLTLLSLSFIIGSCAFAETDNKDLSSEVANLEAETAADLKKLLSASWANINEQLLEFDATQIDPEKVYDAVIDYARKVEARYNDTFGIYAGKNLDLFVEDIERGIFQNDVNISSTTTAEPYRIKLTILNGELAAKVVHPSGKLAMILINLPINLLRSKEITPKTKQVSIYGSRLLTENHPLVVIANIKNEQIEPVQFLDKLSMPKSTLFGHFINARLRALKYDLKLGVRIATYNALTTFSFVLAKNHFLPETAKSIDPYIFVLASTVTWAYTFICSAFSDTYDRAFKSKNPTLETVGRTAFGFMMEIFPKMILINGWDGWTTAVAAFWIAVGTKFASTFMTRNIRLQEEMRLLGGNVTIHAKDIFPVWYSLLFKRKPINEIFKTLSEKNSPDPYAFLTGKKVVLGREFYAYMRFIVKEVATFFDKVIYGTLGVHAATIGLYGMAFYYHNKAEKYALTAAKAHREKGHFTLADQLEKEAQRLRNERYLIPELAPIAQKIGSKLAPVGRGIARACNRVLQSFKDDYRPPI